MSKGLHNDTDTLGLVLRHAYFGVHNMTINNTTTRMGMGRNTSGEFDLATLKRLFSADDVLKKGTPSES